MSNKRLLTLHFLDNLSDAPRMKMRRDFDGEQAFDLSCLLKRERRK